MPYGISIHALAKRATCYQHLHLQLAVTFQSTPSQRGRPHKAQIVDSITRISIHALAKRATKGCNTIFKEYNISIHALAKRATISVKISPQMAVYFNPRPRKEGDYLNGWKNSSTSISIHALAKRATSKLSELLSPSPISIHALAKRATISPLIRLCSIAISIHALAKRATYYTP